MLDKERFLVIKELAKRVRAENETLFDAFKMEAPEDAIREKEEFIETIIDSMAGSFSEGENNKEEKQIFRANVLIPNDEEFLDTYSKDKNIRNLMNTYSVGIEDVMSKITELNIYADYLQKEEPRKPSFADRTEPRDDDFIDAMVNLSSSDAESLLDEIENLSNVMEEFNIAPDEGKIDIKVPTVPAVETPVHIPSVKLPEENSLHMPNIKLPKETSFDNSPKPTRELDYSSDMSIDDISEAVDGFVDDYNSIQIDLDNMKRDLKSTNELVDNQKEQIKLLREESYSLRKNNLELVKSMKDARKEAERLDAENANLRAQLRVMEEQIRRSSALLKKIYNSIPRR